MIKCVIIDDEQHAIDVLQSHIAKVSALELLHATTNPVEAFQFVQQNHTDLIFLDIQMPELDGLQFLKLLNEKSKVILTTAYGEHALEGFEHNVTDYLLKPVLFDRFLKAIQRVIANHAPKESVSVTHQTEKEFLFVKTGTRNKIVKVFINDIEYIESKGNYVTFVTTTDKIMTLLTMKELESELPKSLFVRIHNSYIVAVNNIVALEGNQIQVGKYRLTVGDTYKKSVLKLLEYHIVKKK
ncbi:MAG: response regulator transcription factor [Chitinophagaceae bacterium]|nr:response regulator transcription factor [Chitinophagaceae bacterium]MCW5925606.1 response regulator transcription factor [Chitinophagaceae bacterium]